MLTSMATTLQHKCRNKLAKSPMHKWSLRQAKIKSLDLATEWEAHVRRQFKQRKLSRSKSKVYLHHQRQHRRVICLWCQTWSSQKKVHTMFRQSIWTWINNSRLKFHRRGHQVLHLTMLTFNSPISWKICYSHSSRNRYRKVRTYLKRAAQRSFSQLIRALRLWTH